MKTNMKKDKRLQTAYQKRIEQKMLQIEEQIQNDALTNPLLKKAGEIPTFYKDWLEGAKLVAVLPALEAEHPKAMSYYSVPSLVNEPEQQRIRLSPVFMYINKDFIDITENKNTSLEERFFTFDSEFDKLYSYEKIPHQQKYHFVKKESFEKMRQHLNDNPVVLFFYGCDDGHVGKRFKNESEAFEYLQMIEVFEDIFDNDLQYHN